MANASILIVEDEAIVANDLAKKLRNLGYAVAGTTDLGEEALTLAKDARPDLVLMGIRLAGAMDGVEAAQRIRREYDLPVIYLTASSDRATIQRAKVTEPFGFIPKPFEERDLESHIEMALYRHQAERRLREREEWLRVTLGSIGDAVIACDTAGKVAYLNPVAARLTGWTPEEAGDRPLGEVFHIINELTRQPASDPVARVLREGRVAGLANHTALISRAGQEYAIEDSAAPIQDAQGHILGVVMVFHDVTEKRRAEAAVRESENRAKLAEARGREQQRLNDVLNILPAYVILLSPDYHVPFANRFFEERFGQSKGRRCYEYLFNRTEPCEKCETYSVLKTGAPHRWEWAGPDGRDYDIYDFPFTDTDGSALIMEVGLDVTEIKQTRVALTERTAKLEELVADLEHFSYSITHDMRAPLRGMQGMAELMAEACQGCGEREAKGFLHRIKVSAARMDTLITDALNYSKAVRQELPLSPVDLGALLRGMLDSYPEFQRSKAHIEIRGPLPLLMGNEAGLTQCFSNLLGNAVKFVKPGQKPEISIWAEVRKDGQKGSEESLGAPAPGAESTTRKPDGRTWVRIWVEDKGIGVSPLMLPRVFDMFSRGHHTYEGTGIGLALVRKVAHQMGGRVGVESEQGIGSRFWLEFQPGEGRDSRAGGTGGGFIFIRTEVGDHKP